MRRNIAAAAITASALTGGAIGFAVFGPSSVGAQTGTTTTTTAPSTTQKPDADGGGLRGHHRGGRAGGVAAAAKAIGISQTDLTTALRSGKTIAAVAKSHGVATAKVIDAMVADAKTHIAADVKAGELTQAQADKIQSGLKARVTDMVNGTFKEGDRPGFGGPGHHGDGAGPDQPHA